MTEPINTKTLAPSTAEQIEGLRARVAELETALDEVRARERAEASERLRADLIRATNTAADWMNECVETRSERTALAARVAELETALAGCVAGMDETERRWDGLTRGAISARNDARALLSKGGSDGE